MRLGDGWARMNILLLHLDGKLPNVALMRAAAHHRALGHAVGLRHAPTVAAVEPQFGDCHDRVYASLIFERTRPVAERLLRARPDAVIGGTGWSVTSRLEDFGIDTRAQDYTIYPYPMPFVRTPELLGFQRWVIGAYDKKITWEAWSHARFEPRNLGNKAQAELRFRRRLPMFGGAA